VPDIVICQLLAYYQFILSFSDKLLLQRFPSALRNTFKIKKEVSLARENKNKKLIRLSPWVHGLHPSAG
jgi:hypothetical protein